jgi:hypothetical protein
MRVPKSVRAALGLFATICLVVTARAANISPLSLTGYNYDGIADPGRSNPVGDTTGTLETFSDYFAQGFDRLRPTIGLPAGATFTSTFNRNTTFAIQPFDANNLLLLGGNASPAPSATATLTLTKPSAVSQLAFLITGFNGNIAGSYSLNYLTGAARTGTFVAPDNFGTGNVALSGFGRYLFGTGIQETPFRPELFELDVSADPSRTLGSITFSDIQTMPTGFNGPPVLGVFGVSATAVPEPTTGVLLILGVLCAAASILNRNRREGFLKKNLGGTSGAEARKGVVIESIVQPDYP